MNMTNHNVLILPEAMPADIIEDICDDTGFGPNEPFCFSAIMRPDKDDPGYYRLKINCLEPITSNPYTIDELVYALLSQDEPANGIRYVQPPLERWLEIFHPYMMSLASKLHPRYMALIPEREEMMSILYECVIKLYRKGYYLHNTLVRKSYVNALNYACRKLKGIPLTDSLDAPIGADEDGKEITLMDQLADPDATAWAKSCTEYTQEDFWEDRFEELKAAMLEDMSEFAFNRILIQLKTNTVDRRTSYILDKYRQIFNPDYVPRPNAKGKNRGGQKK